LTYWDRLKVAASPTAVVIDGMMIVDIIFSFDLVNVLFSPAFALPTFVAAYLLSPYIAKHIKYK